MAIPVSVILTLPGSVFWQGAPPPPAREDRSASVKLAIRKAAIYKRASCHTLRHYSAYRIMPNGGFSFPKMRGRWDLSDELNLVHSA